MKRRFRRRGIERSARLFVPLTAVAGLLGCCVYGVLVLVPEFERIRQEAAEVPVAAPQAPAPASEAAPSPPLQASPAQQQTPVVGAVNAPAEASESVADSVQQEGCRAAMSAALANATIEFRSASAQLLPASLRVIEVLAALARACPGEIVIAGHSDNLGPESANLSISAERAAAVEQAFIDFGIAAARLTANGYGSSRPVAENTTVVGRARNRRIEMMLRDRSSIAEQGADNVVIAD